MKILDYDSTVASELIFYDFVGRRKLGSPISALVINQETKEEFLLPVDETTFSIPLTDVINGKSFNRNSTFSIVYLAEFGGVIYRDIIIFNDRLDTQQDYTQDNSKDTEYIFV